MKLRTPRTEVPSSTYKKDLVKLFHPMMFAPILMLVVIGTFLAPQLDPIRFILELIGVSCAVIMAYHLDEIRDKVTAPSVPDWHSAIIMIISGMVAVIIGTYLILITSSLLLIPTFIALIGIFLYNMDIVKSRILYALSWGGTPIFGSYMLQTGELPNLTVIVFTVFGMLLSVKLFWNWGFRGCGRNPICPKYNPSRICHSPYITCQGRITMPKIINDSMKYLQKIELLMLLTLTMGVVCWHYL